MSQKVNHKSKSTRDSINLSSLAASPSVLPLITLIIVVVFFSIFVPHFGTVRTLSGVLSAASIQGIVVIGITLLMICGEFDLSVGSILAAGGFTFALSFEAGVAPELALVLAILVGALLGAVNGLLTIHLRMPSFIVTLGTLSIYRAGVWILSGGLQVHVSDRLPIFELLNGRLDVINQHLTRANFRFVTVWLIVLMIVFQILLTRTRFGNHVFAVGGQQLAAIALGVNRRMVKITCFVISGSLAGLAGVLVLSQFRQLLVSTGRGIQLQAIAAAVIGGTALGGGVGSIVGGVVGVVLVSVLRSGLVLAGMPSDNFEPIVGATIILAVIINNVLQRRL